MPKQCIGDALDRDPIDSLPSSTPQELAIAVLFPTCRVPTCEKSRFPYATCSAMPFSAVDCVVTILDREDKSIPSLCP